MWRRLPHPALAGAVVDLVGYEERASGHFRQIEPASLVVPLVISFGDAFEIGLGRAPRRGDRQTSFVAGLFGGHAVIDSFGACSCIQVNFTPLGAYRFFGHSMHELADTMVSASDVLDRDAWALRDRLGDEPDWHRRFDLIERMLTVRLLSAPVPTPSVVAAYRRIVETHGRGSTAAIAASVNCSRKHLAAKFREEVGLTPKAVARIARFNAAVRLARHGHGWADIAAECRYTDQSHLVREFAAFAGETPSAWKARTA
jgi:AraC-like DNA-binding protein